MLIKKSMAISILCDVHVSLAIADKNGRCLAIYESTPGTGFLATNIQGYERIVRYTNEDV